MSITFHYLHFSYTFINALNYKTQTIPRESKNANEKEREREIEKKIFQNPVIPKKFKQFQ